MGSTETNVGGKTAISQIWDQKKGGVRTRDASAVRSRRSSKIDGEPNVVEGRKKVTRSSHCHGQKRDIQVKITRNHRLREFEREKGQSKKADS